MSKKSSVALFIFAKFEIWDDRDSYLKAWGKRKNMVVYSSPQSYCEKLQ